MFSFFKKDPKDSRPTKGGGGTRSDKGKPGTKPIGRALPEPISRSLNRPSGPTGKFATTENALPDRELARSLAIETAAKIDAIESEMARDFLKPAANTLAGSSTTSGRATASASAAPSVPAPAPELFPKAEARVEAEAELSADDFQGNAYAIEIHTSGAGSVIDETAILFANGQDAEAEATLRAGIDSDNMGHALQSGWLMLFELVNQRGDKAGFEKLTMQYALRFENSPPAWMDYSQGTPSALAGGMPGPVPGAATVKLPEAIDADIVKLLEQLKALASQHASLTLDVSAARNVDLVGAELLLRVVNAFKRASHELTLLGAEHLLTPLRAAIEPGRRDSSDAAWMLLLEVLRLLNKQVDFEETGIQYCITFEVSPPSWERAPPNMRTRAAAATAAQAAQLNADPFEWSGTIGGEGEPYFGRLMLEARNTKKLSVECRMLRRMAFPAASALLSLVMKLQTSGAAVEFRNVNALVAALFHLLGITAVATVQQRRN